MIFAGAYSLLPIFVLLRLWKQDDPNAALHMRWACVWWRDEPSYLHVEQALEQLGGFDVSKELKTLQRVAMRNEELDKALAELSSPEWPLRWRARQICLRFGGMAAKQLSLAEHDPSPGAGAYTYAKTLIGDISTDTTDRLRHGRYICPACCCDVARQRARRKRFYGCRRCGRSHHVLHAAGRIVCILDRQSENKIDRVSDELHINWLLTRCLPDCERVRIGDVGDQDVEAFVVAIQNENDPKSRRRYAKMICTIDDSATLHENSLRMLRQTFRRVHMRPRPAQPAVAVVSAVPAEEGSNGRL